MGALEAWDR